MDNLNIRATIGQILKTNGFDDHLTDDEWVLLDDRLALLQPIRDGEPDGLERAASAVRDMRRTYWDSSSAPPHADDEKGNGPARPVSPSVNVGSHAEAITRIVAAYAKQELGPTIGLPAFRREVLNGRLLRLEAVEDWIQARAIEDGKPTVSKTRLPGGGEKIAVKLLAYGKAGSEWTFHVPTRHRGVLDRLRLISEQLVRAFDWPPAQATLFVIVDSFTPWVQPIRTAVHISGSLQCLSRIVLTVDPTCTPAEVADCYQRVKTGRYGRLRRLSEKHAALAAFRAEQPAGRTAGEQLRIWNSEVARKRREWKYKQLKLFVRDAKTALERLICPGGTGGRRNAKARTT